MKKYTTLSLAVLAALFSSGVQALDFNDIHAASNAPTHTLGLGSVPAGLLGAGDSNDLTTSPCSIGESIKNRIRGDCSDGCKPDNWGCGDGHFLQAGNHHQPTNR